MFETEYSFEAIAQRLRESAYLTKGVWITLRDERNERERSFYFEGGLVSFVRHLNRNKEALHSRPIYCERRDGTTTIEVALKYNDSYAENVLAFANNINTVDGGTHITGFRRALTRSLNDWAKRAGVLKDADGNLSGDDVREGLTAVVSVKLTEPPFEGQTKAKLGNAEVAGQVEGALADDIVGMFAELLPRVQQLVVTKSFHRRAADPQVLVQMARASDCPVVVVDRVEDALEEAIRLADGEALVLTTGSIFVAAGVRESWYKRAREYAHPDNREKRGSR